MSDARQSPVMETRDAIEAQAADFLHRRRVLRWSEADQVELNAWLDESTLHRVAYLRLVAGEALIEKMGELHPRVPHRPSSVARMRFTLPFLATAASLGLIAALGFSAERYFLQPPPADRTYSTEVGGRALLSFPDKTQIELNTDTVVRTRMTTAERTVWLEKGEAWFRVAHDAAHPFAVVVGNHRVTDLGTEFVVRNDPGRFEVALLKGRAQLATSGDHAQVAMLAPGDEAIATPAAISFARKTPQQLADELAWQHGVLKFRNTRLSDAVREINRYNQVKLVIDDPAVAQMSIGGDFRTDSIDGFLQATQMVLKLRAVREGDSILLARASQTSASTTTKAAKGPRSR